MKLFELKLDACISCNTSIVDARNLMRSISRAIVKRIINAGATLTKIQPVYPPIKSQLEVATEYMEGKVSANWRESGQMAGENKRRGLEKGNYTISALVNGAVVVIFRCTTKLATIGASNLSLHVKILRAISKFISPMFQPASLQDTRFSSSFVQC